MDPRFTSATGADDSDVSADEEVVEDGDDRTPRGQLGLNTLSKNDILLGTAGNVVPRILAHGLFFAYKPMGLYAITSACGSLPADFQANAPT